MNVREWALPVYTVLMQLAIGALFTLWSVRSRSLNDHDVDDIDRFFRMPILVVFLTIIVAMIGSHFHLSRPYLSFLAVLNFSSSWLSREIVFTILLFLSCGLLTYLIWFQRGHTTLKTALGWFSTLSGCAGIFCMSSLYLIPTQPSWNTPNTILSFYATALILGVTSACAFMVMDTILSDTQEPRLSEIRHRILQHSFSWFTVLVGLGTVIIIFLNVGDLSLMRNGDELMQMSLSLLLGVYRPLLILRFIMLVVGAAVLEFAVLRIQWGRKPLMDNVAPIYLACLLILIGEILGRFLFYAVHIRVGV